MKQNRFPEDWNEERVQRVLAAYEAQSEQEAVAEDEASMEASVTLMRVPRDLVPLIREMIARREN